MNPIQPAPLSLLMIWPLIFFDLYLFSFLNRSNWYFSTELKLVQWPVNFMTIWILLFVILGVSGEEVFRMMQENLLAVVLTSYVKAKVNMAASIFTDKKKMQVMHLWSEPLVYNTTASNNIMLYYKLPNMYQTLCLLQLYMVFMSTV